MQHYGCVVLWILAVYYYNKVTIAAEGGIAMILSAMETHLYNAKVQHYGCGALWNLVVNNEDNKVTIAKEGVITTTILNAMKYHLDKAKVQN